MISHKVVVNLECKLNKPDEKEQKHFKGGISLYSTFCLTFKKKCLNKNLPEIFDVKGFHSFKRQQTSVASQYRANWFTVADSWYNKIAAEKACSR